MLCNLIPLRNCLVLYLICEPEIHAPMFTFLTASAVFLQRRSSLRRTLPSHTTPPPRLAPGFLRGTQDPCPLATLPLPLLHQRDPLRRSPQLGNPVSVTVLCGEREPTAGFTKTSTVSLLFTPPVSSCCVS